MIYLSLCTGMAADKVAWESLGWEPGAFSEINPACCDLLRYRYPDTPNLGDMTAPYFIERARERGPYDLICAGTPCQSFSIAGLIKGLNDERGNLTLRFVEICNEIGTNWIFWENVRDVLSDKTNAFGCLLAGLVGESAPLIAPGGKWTDAGYVAGPERAVAWRVLDAQYFGLAQRRRRVFLVAVRAGIGIHPGQVLFEPESVRRHSPPRREKGQGITGTIGGSSQSGGFRTTDLDNSGAFIPEEIACPITGQNYRDNPSRESLLIPEIAHSLKSRHDGSEDGTGRGTPLVPAIIGSICPGAKPGTYNGQDIDKMIPVAYSVRMAQTGSNRIGVQEDRAHTLDTNGGAAIAFNHRQDPVSSENLAFSQDGRQSQGVLVKQVQWSSGGGEVLNDTTQALRAGAEHNYQFALQGMAVRRLTPRECERLMGFPDDYSLIPRKNGKMIADGPRYKMLGNSWAVPIVRWIGERIEKVNALQP